MSTGRLHLVLSPRWYLLDASITIAVDGVPQVECGLSEGTEFGPIEVEAGKHEVVALLVGLVRRHVITEIEVEPHHEVVVEIDHSRMTGKLSLRIVSDRVMSLAERA